MPYPNYHSARIQDPDDFEKLRTKKIADGVLLIVGRLTGETKTSTQAYRFDKEIFTATEAKAWLKKHKIKYTSFEAAKKTTSSIFSSIDAKPEIEDNSITIPFVKDGTKAFDAKGKKHTITSEALDSSYDSYVGGIVTVNHKIREQGIISEVCRRGEFVDGTITGLSDEAIEIIGSSAYRGVSQESVILEENDTNITKLRGTGVTLVIYPEKPACDIADGCGAPIASIESGTWDYEKYDVGTINNSGALIKTSEISIYVSENEPLTDEERKMRFAREVVWNGIGTYEIFEHNEDLKVGDEINPDAESIHKVDITVSNIPLNTSETKEEVSGTQTRGTTSMAKETDSALEALQTEVKTLKIQSTALTSEMAEHKTQLEQKDAEIAKLTSTITDKDAEIAKAKDGIGAQITSALEAHDQAIAVKTDLETAKADLRKVMSKDETYDAFMKTEPSAEVIRSTITALKDVLPEGQVGSSAGSETDGSTPTTSGIFTPGKGYED